MIARLKLALRRLAPSWEYRALDVDGETIANDYGGWWFHETRRDAEEELEMLEVAGGRIERRMVGPWL